MRWSAKMGRTGDRVRYLPDGEIEFLGRVDSQVKIRGFRIELEEIEVVLNRHPLVRQAVIVVREDVPGNKRLAAYVVPQPGAHLTILTLRHFVQDTLPDYMVPATFMFLDALPLTPNGKVDRRALPAPVRTRDEDDSFVPPVLPIHAQLIQIWEELLAIQPIGIRDDFFALGGHSLSAARLVYQIEQIWGKKITLATLLAEPTIGHLADVLLRGDEANSGDTKSDVLVKSADISKRPFFSKPGAAAAIFAKLRQHWVMGLWGVAALSLSGFFLVRSHKAVTMVLQQKSELFARTLSCRSRKG